MSLPSVQNRKPYERASYATLNNGDDGAAPAQPSLLTVPKAANEPASSDYYAQEAGKLEQLRGALWEAFQSGPAVSIPAALIDLTVAYTSALRLELNLLGCSKPNPINSKGFRGLPAALRDKPPP
jgi:hypothetical protein